MDLDALDKEVRASLLEEMVWPRLATAFNRYAEYPRDAVIKCIEGMVKLELVIDPHGKIEDITIGESSGETVLDDAALAVAARVKSDIETNPLVKRGHCLADQLELVVPLSYEMSAQLVGPCSFPESLKQRYKDKVALPEAVFPEVDEMDAESFEQFLLSAPGGHDGPQPLDINGLQDLFKPAQERPRHQPR